MKNRIFVNYLKALDLLQKLLLSNNEPFWANWMQKDIEDWNSSESTEHHLNAFGGAGSFNDINLNFGGRLGPWKNALMGYLSSISYCFAKDRSFEIPDKKPKILDGAACQNCKRVEINENTLSRFLADKFIPIFINEYFLTDSFLFLLDLEKLSKDERIAKFEEQLINELTQMNIHINQQNAIWANNCIVCNTNEKVYWEYETKLL